MTTLINTLVAIVSTLSTITLLLGISIAPNETIDAALVYAPYVVGSLMGLWIVSMLRDIFA